MELIHLPPKSDYPFECSMYQTWVVKYRNGTKKYPDIIEGVSCIIKLHGWVVISNTYTV